MSTVQDAFSHHPELRNKISDPMTSFFRTFSIEKLAALSMKHGLSEVWWHSDEEREALRAKTLANVRDSDLWVFAYGSLMWDPAFQFEEVRRAHVPDYSRRFILKDIHGGRGTLGKPGLMAALDKGPGCDGLAFRIARENLDAETKILWTREQVGPAYVPVFVEATASDRRITALAFAADYEAALIDGSLTRAQQIEYCATGTGFLGTSVDYLRNVASQFTALGIKDEEVTGLLRDTEAYIKSRS